MYRCHYDDDVASIQSLARPDRLQQIGANAADLCKEIWQHNCKADDAIDVLNPMDQGRVFQDVSSWRSRGKQIAHLRFQHNHR